MTSTRLHCLQKNNVTIEHLHYVYTPKGGTRTVSEQYGIDEKYVIKTIIFINGHEKEQFVAALMHGNARISTRKLEKLSNIRYLHIASPLEVLQKTGFAVGSVCPFLLPLQMPLFVQRSICDLEYIMANGGKHGLLHKLSPACFSVLPCTIGDIQKD